MNKSRGASLPFYVLILRHLEKTDPEVTPPVDQEYSDDLSRLEDHDVTNQFSAMGSLKPGFVRLLTIFGVLLTVDYAARHLLWAGQLGVKHLVCGEVAEWLKATAC